LDSQYQPFVTGGKGLNFADGDNLFNVRFLRELCQSLIIELGWHEMVL
jgi:hypothetical protein